MSWKEDLNCLSNIRSSSCMDHGDISMVVQRHVIQAVARVYEGTDCDGDGCGCRTEEGKAAKKLGGRSSSSSRLLLKVESNRGIPLLRSSLDYLVRHGLLLGDSLHTLILDHCQLTLPTIETIRPLCQFLIDPRCSLKSLQLPGNRLGDEACQILLHSLTQNSTVLDIDLNSNYLETMEGGRDLANPPSSSLFNLLTQRKDPLMRLLDLSYNWIQGSASLQLAMGLTTSRLQELNLRGCLLGDGSVLPILQQLAHPNRYLLRCNLSVNALTHRSLEPLANLLLKNGTLQVLNLSWNSSLFGYHHNSEDEQFSDDEQDQEEIDPLLLAPLLQKWSEALEKNASITSLDLSHCGLANVAKAGFLFRALTQNTSLQRLDVSHNDLDPFHFDDDDDNNNTSNALVENLPYMEGLRYLIMDDSHSVPSEDALAANFSLFQLSLVPRGHSYQWFPTDETPRNQHNLIFARNRAVHQAQLLVQHDNEQATACYMALDEFRKIPAAFHVLLRQRLWRQTIHNSP